MLRKEREIRDVNRGLFSVRHDIILQNECDVLEGTSMRRKILSLMIAVAMLVSSTVVCSTVVVHAGKQKEKTAISELSSEQLTSLAMLNYLTVLTAEINSASHSKVFLDNAYSEIYNNVMPDKVDEDTQYQIENLMDTIEEYRTIEVKRERLKYIYEQNKANAVYEAIPNPLSVMNVVHAGSILKSMASIAYLAVDSYGSYKKCMSELEGEYLKDGWELDDEAARNLHESRKDAFSYMVEMCRNNNIAGKLSLNEDAVDSFAEWENKGNVIRTIEYLEKHKSTYRAYGKYWLVLAKCYYDNGNYGKCLKAIDKYETLDINIFRKDYDFAKAMSFAIAAAQENCSGREYIERAEHYTKIITSNTEDEEWFLKYVAAETNIHLYKCTGDRTYLQNAYSIAKDNVNVLIDEQHNKNKIYLAEIEKAEPPKTATKAEKKEIKKYNKMLKKERKIELPPIYQPLAVNCELLFNIAKELGISEGEKRELNAMLHSGNEKLFLTEPLDNYFWFDSDNECAKSEIEFSGKKLVIPAQYLGSGCKIEVSVTENGKTNTYKDWEIQKVKREKENDVSTFKATYKSKKIKKQDYGNNADVKMKIMYPKGVGCKASVYKFKVSSDKILFVIDQDHFEMVK